jgi:beta-N-acetylhexosaminidase
MVDVRSVAASLGTAPNRAVAQAIGDASVTLLQLRPTRRLPVPERWSVLLTGWDDAGVRTLEDALRGAGRTVEARWTGAAPTKREVKAVAKAQRRHDITVIVTAYLGADPRQRQLVRRLQRAGRTIIVGVRSPYDASWFPGPAPVHVATYGSAPASMQALARIMQGEIGPSGKSPVDIPYPGRDEALFGFGTGLNWEPR